ncbi:MAG TPA: hypothetical protein VK809_03855 [Bacteroidia bacterium]|jgi:hypothetical protein|nr:hypothetical protein [Bacteroidia bacterium]
MPKPVLKKENILLHFFKRNWIQILVIAGLFMMYHNVYIDKVLDYPDSKEVAIRLIIMALGSILVGVVIMLLLRLVEWGLHKMQQ